MVAWSFVWSNRDAHGGWVLIQERDTCNQESSILMCPTFPNNAAKLATPMKRVTELNFCVQVDVELAALVPGLKVIYPFSFGCQ